MGTPSMTAIDDREAVALCRSGDDGKDRGFRVIFERYAPELLGFCRRMAGAEQADDIVQEAFIRLYQAFDRLDPDRPVRPYLFKITHHVALRVLRETKGRKHKAAFQEDRAVAAEDVPAEASRRELRAAIDAALAGLAPEHRAAFVLRHVNGLKVTQVAEVFGCSERTARNRIHAAYVLLERALDRRGIGPGEV